MLYCHIGTNIVRILVVDPAIGILVNITVIVCVVVTAVISTHISCNCGGVSFAATANSVCSNTPYSEPTAALLTRCTDDHSKCRCACDKRSCESSASKAGKLRR
jgi:hypothetical protein